MHARDRRVILEQLERTKMQLQVEYCSIGNQITRLDQIIQDLKQTFLSTPIRTLTPRPYRRSTPSSPSGHNVTSSNNPASLASALASLPFNIPGPSGPSGSHSHSHSHSHQLSDPSSSCSSSSHPRSQLLQANGQSHSMFHYGEFPSADPPRPHTNTNTLTSASNGLHVPQTNGVNRTSQETGRRQSEHVGKKRGRMATDNSTSHHSSRTPNSHQPMPSLEVGKELKVFVNASLAKPRTHSDTRTEAIRKWMSNDRNRLYSAQDIAKANIQVRARKSNRAKTRVADPDSTRLQLNEREIHPPPTGDSPQSLPPPPGPAPTPDPPSSTCPEDLKGEVMTMIELHSAHSPQRQPQPHPQATTPSHHIFPVPITSVHPPSHSSVHLPSHSSVHPPSHSSLSSPLLITPPPPPPPPPSPVASAIKQSDGFDETAKKKRRRTVFSEYQKSEMLAYWEDRNWACQRNTEDLKHITKRIGVTAEQLRVFRQNNRPKE